VTKEDERHVTIEAEAEEDQVLFTTIPYETGWRAYVDGVQTEPVKAVDALLAVPLTPGAHEIKLEFWPWQITAGLALSALGWLIFAALALAEAGRKRKKQGPTGGSGVFRA
jgi:uncharacterized membrane protein YfhO